MNQRTRDHFWRLGLAFESNFLGFEKFVRLEGGVRAPGGALERGENFDGECLGAALDRWEGWKEFDRFAGKVEWDAARDDGF